MSPADQELADKIKTMRDTTETIVAAMIDRHMAKHYPDVTPFWEHCKRADIEVSTWPVWKRRSCYSQDD